MVRRLQTLLDATEALNHNAITELNSSNDMTSSATAHLKEFVTDAEVERARLKTAAVVLGRVAYSEGRKKVARAGAEALHNKLGGSRDKAARIRVAWATGKYASRDACAEKEGLALGMSFSTARKALRNTPDPA